MRDSKLYFYEKIADKFDDVANTYDTQRRVEIVFDELLAAENLAGLSVLDVGCGTGWFSARASARGARVTSLDIGIRLLALTRSRCTTRPVAGDACALPFGTASFDVVISSECIEHTLDPAGAVREIHRVTRPGGLLLVTTPNRVWHFAATFGTWIGLRPYEGYEHWLAWGDMRRVLGELRARVVEMRGFHLVPPIVPASWPVLRRLDRLGAHLGPIMVNMAVLARKAGA
jgi:ubiquinone/menaquinone biosynthesis C-methylase UbiE